MKKMMENRYPHSATLFKFCKEALEIRYQGNVKVIDQDVGAILGYDPADCSHWKKGKKNIRALTTLRSIADHLKIDERLLIDIASGRMDLEEAVFEYKGYGEFDIKGNNLENLKKEFFKNPAKWQGETSTTRSFEELFDINRVAVVRAAEAVVTKGNFTEAPLYIPELFQLYPGIKLISEENMENPIQITEENGQTVIRFHGPEMKPYLRFILAKELFKFLVKAGEPGFGSFANAPAEVQEIRANLFASILLIPGEMLRKEVGRIDSSIDIIQQLAETFWVSKSLMNLRLRDYMTNNN